MENTGNTIVALLTGAVVGAGLAILYAPEKGEETRRRISEEAKKAKSKFDKDFNETTDRLSVKARKSKKQFDSRLEETLSSASYKADDIITALEGRLEELRKKNAKLKMKKEGPKGTTESKDTATA